MVSTHLQASGVQVDAGSDPGVTTSPAVATVAAGSATYDFRAEWDVKAVEPLLVSRLAA
jgi:fructokinase